ncbi:HAD-IA family hydrolase [Streptomyces sp. NPDC001851]|uniref:HAD-IA family hydrolase n=1 Tax=Streptomyces sp. NPDC001851 TaxID=3154529 RepID=UPI00331A2AA0
MTPYRTLTPHALLFDMDGTLVDSTVVVERTWRRFARRHGLDAERILATAHGRRTGETVARYAPAGVDVAAETARLVAEEVEDVEGVVAVPGAPELLAALPEDRWAVVTSAGRELTHRRMAAAGLPLPPLLISADDVREGKPSPEGYLAAAAALRVPAAATVVFEDAEAGLRAAVAAGATPVVVGAHRGPAAEGLLRVRDLREVTLTGADHAALHLALQPAAPYAATPSPAAP